MCFHYSMSQVAQNLENRYNAPVATGTVWDPVHHVSGFTFPLMPVVANSPTPKIGLASWGLIPSWVKDSEQAAQMQSMTLNARSESVFDKASFRKSILSRRCLIPADGFFEWQTVGTKKIPWYIKLKDQEILSFGGIWDLWRDPQGKPTVTYSIITTEANPLMAEIHNSKKRMPLILPAGEETAWLDPSQSPENIRAMLVPFPESGLEAWTISKLITTRGANTNIPEVKHPYKWE